MDCEGEEKEEVRWNKVSAEKIPRVDVMCSCRIECERLVEILFPWRGDE